MGKYSIKELEKLSGIKAHTIRIWEKRHRLIEPQRTNTNIRFYSDDDLKKIINVSVLNNNGLKISKIAGMSGDEMHRMIMELTSQKNEASIHIDQLVISMVELDEEKFERILAGLTLRFGFEKTVIDIIYPFLEKIGILWQTAHITPAQEHFISNLIRQKIIVAIDSLPLPPSSAKKVMLFLPEHELHELSLLFTNYLTRKAGLRTCYLGQAVPFSNLKSTYASHQPKILITCITSAITKLALENYVNRLATEFPDASILLMGYQVKNFQPKHNHVHVLTGVQELSTHL